MIKLGHWVSVMLATSAIACGNAAKAVETVTYSYDDLGRLARVERSGTVNSGVDSRYAYDPADNRTQVTVAAGPTVVGGGFELPEVHAGYSYRDPRGPAMFGGNSGLSGNGSIWGVAAAPEGDQVGFLQSYGVASVITLSVTGLTPGLAYKVRFWLAVRHGHGPNPVTVAFDGAPLGTFVPGSAAFSAVTSATFTASGPAGSLSFTGSASPADLGSGLDGVTILPAGKN